MAGVGRTAALIQLNSDGKPELIGPDNPLYISGGGGGGGGDVNSVNGKTGTVVLNAADVGALPTSYEPAAEDISDATAVGRSVLTAASAAAARSAIGAGTSSLALGTTGSTAKAGNYQPTAANISDATATGRSVLTAADAAAARTAIGAGTPTSTISQANAENPASTSSGLATGQRLAQAIAAFVAANNVLVSDGTVTEVVWLTQTEYDAIPSPSDDIEYHILADE